MEIELIEAHEKQLEIVDACLDDAYSFIVAVIGRQFGKTTIAENIAVYWALEKPNTTVYWVSPTFSQALKVYKEIVNAIVESGAIKSKKQGRGDTEMVFQNDSKIVFRSAESEDSLRGQSVHYMILDEAAFVKRSTVETILLPMLSVIGKKALFITTPKGKNYIHDYFLRGQGDAKFKSWKSLRYSTYDSPLANEEMIKIFKESLPEKLFQQEIEAKFVDSSSVFNNVEELLCLNKLNGPEPGRNYWAGIDIGFVNDASVLSIVDDEGNLVCYYRWTDIEAPELIQEIVKINNLWKFKSVVIENNNQGLVIYQDLRRKMNNISDFNTNSKTKGEIINRLIHLFNTKDILLINDEQLRTELEAFIFLQNDNGHIKFMADNGFHDDIVMSLAIAVWAKETKGSGNIQVFQLGNAY